MMSFRYILNTFVVFSLQQVCAAISSTGFTVSLTDIPYFLPPQSVATLPVAENLKAAFSNETFLPFSILKSHVGVPSVATQYLAEDDVFQAGFLEGTYPRALLNLWHYIKLPRNTICIKRKYTTSAYMIESGDDVDIYADINSYICTGLKRHNRDISSDVWKHNECNDHWSNWL